ncbi:PadR family transcriptional regulator [Streptomyces sp. NPDC051658]|uniref:PadR family transcriptional regulator n=1 Tax=unclassified Streptomyces TaxID=2593676 RepID=UPI0022598351|nr:PadR family transcriptional regulator [Streptomyces sp. NBC_00893]MCX4851929.1 PadR family transcriptional regulator [Streptomyces sp. NBC_00893]
MQETDMDTTQTGHVETPGAPAGGTAGAGPAEASPLALVFLGLLLERPMTPRELARTLAERAADSPVEGPPAPAPTECAAVARALGEAGLTETVAHADGPAYALTDRGRSEFARAVVTRLATFDRQPPAFLTAVGYLGALDEDRATGALRERAGRLRERAARIERALAASDGIPRLFLIENEYALRMCRAELGWVEEVLSEIGAGTLAWPRVRVTENGWEWEPEDGAAAC